MHDLFQSTHPLRGATVAFAMPFTVMVISIHAPLAGCDRPNNPLAMVAEFHFNPRTPCGVRQQQNKTFFGHILFQSTHPLRGATHWHSQR